MYLLYISLVLSRGQIKLCIYMGKMCEQDRSWYLGNIFPPACKLHTGVVVKYSDQFDVTDVRKIFYMRDHKLSPKY